MGRELSIDQCGGTGIALSPRGTLRLRIKASMVHSCLGAGQNLLCPAVPGQDLDADNLLWPPC